VAKRHDWQLQPDGARQCSKCLEVRVLGAVPLIVSDVCPNALDEIPLKSVLGVDKKADYMKMLGEEMPGLPEGFEVQPSQGKNFLAGLGIDLEDLGL